MTFCDVYIGDIDDPSFSWEGGNSSGNIPVRLSPFIGGHREFSELISRINDGTYIGRQTDWGGYVAKVSKGEIIDFLKTVSGISMEPGSNDQIIQFVQGLDENKIHALVASEL